MFEGTNKLKPGDYADIISAAWRPAQRLQPAMTPPPITSISPRAELPLIMDLSRPTACAACSPTDAGLGQGKAR